MKKILRYLSVKQLMEDIADLNGVMSVRRFVLSTMLAGVAVYGACLLYRINYIAELFVILLQQSSMHLHILFPPFHIEVLQLPVKDISSVFRC